MKQTKEQMMEEIEMAKKNEWINYEVMASQTEGTAVKVGQFTAEGSTVTMWVINPTRAHGGIVQIRSLVHANNSPIPSFTASYLEDEHKFYGHADIRSEFGYQMRELIGKAYRMRNLALEEVA